MGAISSDDWLRSFLATQNGVASQNMLPNGEAWTQFLNLFNPAVGMTNGIMGPANGYLFGGPDSLGQLYQQHQNINGFYGGLPQQFQNLLGGTQNGSDFIQSYLRDTLGAMSSQRDFTLNGFAGGPTQQGQLLNEYGLNFMNGQTPGMSSMQGAGTNLLDNRGANAWNMNMQDVGSSAMANGGWTPQLGGIAEYLGNFLGGGGSNQNMDSGLAQALQMIQNGGNTPQSGALGQIGNQASGYGNQMLQGGGLTPFLENNMAGINRIVGERGNMPQLQQLQQMLMPEIASGSYGGLGTGFQGANDLINSGGQSDITNMVAQLGLMNAMGLGPNPSSSVGSALPSFQEIMAMSNQGNAPIMPQSVGGGSVSARALGDGMTGDLQAMYDRGMSEIDNNPLMSTQQVAGMARDQAGTAFQQQMEAMMNRAQARGGGPGANAGSGSANRAMFEFGDQGAQAEAAAMRDAVLRQQDLQLGRNMKLSDLANLAQGIAAQRRGQDASLAGQEMSANASLQGQAMSANAQLQAAAMAAQNQAANSRNSMLSSLANTYAGLQGQREGLANQRQLAGMESLLGAGNQETQRLLGGINALPGLQGASNQRQGMNLDALMSGIGMQSGRELGALGLTPGVSGAQTANVNAGTNLLNTGVDAQGTAGQLNNANLGLGFNALQGLEGLRSNNVLGGLGILNDSQRNATNQLLAGGQLGESGDRSQLGWAGLGGELLNNVTRNQLGAFGELGNQNANNNQYQLGMGNLLNQMNNTNLGATGQYAQNNNNMGELNLDNLTRMIGAMGQGFTQGQNSLGAINNNFWSGMGVNTGFANNFMNYLNGAQQGFYGVNPSSGGGTGFLGGLLGNWLNNMQQGAARSMFGN